VLQDLPDLHLEHGPTGAIRSEEMQAAGRIVRWHLSEARRLLADMDTPTALASAIRLDARLRNEALANNTDHVPTKRIYQYGPNCVRDSRDLRAALAVLAERGRARLQEDGRRRVVVINPGCWVTRHDLQGIQFPHPRGLLLLLLLLPSTGANADR
jgi:hypothetical protein